ncbi:AMP-binding protein [Kocuria flava]|uniref:Pls/PosA family non-ribosomal peptide synthetase n=1 Tax=Kocuria flava TaxID=446860 RepID=UPI001FF52166|nr:Pls/PosA family non-ribosomal peptide synthetase [Kocuria flava]MCJ8504335.1 AMP-binding protein [Kocuria flava]MCJ8504338.1 AMP-binding protein [Kocuria flava]
MTVRPISRSGSTGHPGGSAGAGSRLAGDGWSEENGVLETALRTQPLPTVRGRAVYPAVAPPAPRTLVDIVLDTVNRHPGAVAIDDGGTELTYAQLLERVEAEAQRLWDLDVGRGDRVGIRVPSGTVDLYVAILGTIFAGAAYVPVDFDDPDERANTVWEEAGVAVVYGAGLALERRPGVRTGADSDQPRTTDDAWIIFTSGSTGKPKGVAISHRSAAALVDAEAELYLPKRPLGPRDRVMAGLSVAFDASCEEMWLAWRSGAALVPAPRSVVRSGTDLGPWLVERGITAVSTVPTLASMWPAEALERIRLLIFGGEACPNDLAARLVHPGREVWNTYGPTEATVIATGAILTGEPPVRIGLPLPGWELAVVDSSGNPVRWGEEGELIIGGVGLGRYLDPAKDAEKFAPMDTLGWERAYRSGDVVRADPEGIVFVGRADDQVKISGRRVEMGEIDEQMTRLPGVAAGAAAVHTTPAGNQVLVGYLVPQEPGSIDVQEARRLLADRLPGQMVPALALMDELPMKTSGKVDRKALPWPLPGGSTAVEAPALEDGLEWLAGLWADQLGPLPIDRDSDFFALGGTSVAVAKLVSELRRTYPGAEIAQLYRHPTLQEMHEYLESLERADVVARDAAAVSTVRDTPRRAGLVQVPFLVALYAVSGLRYVVGSLLVVWVLFNLFGAGWVPDLPLLPLLAGWLVLFALPGRMVLTALFIRLLTFRLRPGAHARGSWTHLRVWMAERVLIFNKFDPVMGTPLMAVFFRMLGNRVGDHAHLDTMPPVSGLAVVGSGAAVEHEVDLSGYWLEGDVFHLGTVTVGENARVGARTLLDPGAVVEAGAEVEPGSHVVGTVPAGRLAAGSPLEDLGEARASWPAQRAGHDRPLRTWALYSLGLGTVGLLPVLAILPGGLLAFSQVRDLQFYEAVFPVLALWVPVFAVLTLLTYLALVVVLVRLLARMITPGHHRAEGPVGWAVWLTGVLLQKSLVSTYPVYASIATPLFLRLLGARVGRQVEISTVETLPHLSTFASGSFMADHSMVSAPRTGFGWLHVGHSSVGERSFVGNSAVVGADRDLPADSLVAVLSSAPEHAEPGTSWLGRTPEQIARTSDAADEGATYRPRRRLVVARTLVESLRIVPFMVTAWIDLAIVYALTTIYMGSASPAEGLVAVLLWATPVVLAAGVVAALIPVLVKWALMGRFTQGERPLFSSFVWRNELADVFAESLAVPGLIRLAVGSPVFNVWARMMGARIERGVWCETWWLPEFDLVHLGRGVSVNRGTVLQTHLFQDRIMRLQPVRMEAGSTLGPNSFVLPGSTVEEGATVYPGSLVMAQETVPAGTRWGGNPIRPMSTHADQLVEAGARAH